jgi:hypothetical protein
MLKIDGVDEEISCLIQETSCLKELKGTNEPECNLSKISFLSANPVCSRPLTNVE